MVQTEHTRISTITSMNENNPQITNPITRLALGSITAGLLITSYMTPTQTPPMTMPTLTKTATILATILGTILAWELTASTHILSPPKQNPHLNFSSTLGYFNPLAHRLSSSTLLNMGQKVANHLMDLSWYKKAGPEGLANLQTMTTQASTLLHKGLIKAYLGSSALSILIALTLL